MSWKALRIFELCFLDLEDINSVCLKIYIEGLENFSKFSKTVGQVELIYFCRKMSLLCKQKNPEVYPKNYKLRGTKFQNSPKVSVYIKTACKNMVRSQLRLSIGNETAYM